ncbi:MAG: tetratricopeptide repeat protein, partial [Sphingobium sp.]
MSGGLEAIFLKAKRAEQRGEEAEARRLLTDVLNKYPKNRTAIGGLARLDDLRAGTGGASQAGLDDMLRSFAVNDFAATVAKGLALVQRFPKAAEIWNLLGAAYIDLNDTDSAERAFRKAVDADPNHEAAQKNLLLCFRRQGKPEDAEQIFRSFIDLNPQDMEARCKLATFYRDQDRMEDARDTCLAALAVDPTHAETYFQLGLVHLNARDNDKAIESLLKAISLKPDHFDAIFHMGHALYAMGHFANAIDVYHQATLVGPQESNAFVRFADTLRLVGIMDRSHDAFLRAHELKPDSANIKAHLLYQKAVICDWSTRHEFRDIPTTPPLGDGIISPFIALTFEDDGARQLARSRSMAKGELTFPQTFTAPAVRREGRIRIGYFSADFHEHATMHLIGGLLREHDRERFEIRIYNFGGPSDVLGPRVAPYVDAIVDVRDMTDEQTV